MGVLDSRRGILHIGSSLYSFKLVDLPCIIEAQKTLDNKQMFKVADICQVCHVCVPPVSKTHRRRCWWLGIAYTMKKRSRQTGTSVLMNSSGRMALLRRCTTRANDDSGNESTSGFVRSAAALVYTLLTCYTL